MADKSALQMCESLVQQLPAQAPTRTQNPMWAFLKGIEGFDETRAAECLGRLLDAHYDTIGVLKLATKQDLIDDVGLKAGDALRIVSAAKRAVPRPSTPTSIPCWNSLVLLLRLITTLKPVFECWFLIFLIFYHNFTELAFIEEWVLEIFRGRNLNKHSCESQEQRKKVNFV
jgi:hypothetical protein